MKGKRLLLGCTVLSLACALACGGCFYSAPQESDESNPVVAIEKTGTEGAVDTYTITFKDGSTTTMQITNGVNGTDGANGTDGVNGKDGQDLSLSELYSAYRAEYPTATYEEFLQAMCAVNVGGNEAAIHRALQSSAKVYAQFYESKTGYSHGETKLYSGSAVVYQMTSTDVYFLTNYHVAYSGDAIDNKISTKMTCYLYGSEDFPSKLTAKDAYGRTQYNYGEYAIECEYVAGSVTADLALLRASKADVFAINDAIVPVTFAEEYHVGQSAIAIGNANGEGISVTEGIISVDNEYTQLNIDGTTRSYRSMRIDTAIYHGNSGGGLFDYEGKLIGITNSGTETYESINYAIPLGIVKNVAKSLYDYSGSSQKQAKKITFGVTVQSQNSKYVYDAVKGFGKIVEEISVSEITAGSVAEAMGLQVGDVITGLYIGGDYTQFDTSAELGDLCYAVREGDVIALTYTRGGTARTGTSFTVTAGNLTWVE